MDLNFVENAQGKWAAEFKAPGPFALHIERDQVGRIEVYQSTVEGAQYARVDAFPSSEGFKKVIDQTFSGEIFPVFIRIESETKPAMAVVTTKA